MPASQNEGMNAAVLKNMTRPDHTRAYMWSKKVFASCRSSWVGWFVRQVKLLPIAGLRGKLRSVFETPFLKEIRARYG